MTTIDDLKEMIMKHLELYGRPLFPMHQLRLMCQGRRMECGRLLTDCAAKPAYIDSIRDTSQREASAPSPPVTLSVEVLYGTTFTITVPLSETVRAVKANTLTLQKPPNLQVLVLFFASEDELVDDCSLASYGIYSSNTLHVVDRTNP